MLKSRLEVSSSSFDLLLLTDVTTVFLFNFLTFFVLIQSVIVVVAVMENVRRASHAGSWYSRNCKSPSITLFLYETNSNELCTPLSLLIMNFLVLCYSVHLD